MYEGDSYYGSLSKLVGTRILIQTPEYGRNIVLLKKTIQRNKDDYQGKRDFQEQQELF